ncbi:N-acetylmuramoyl-L-alanine amidase CwlD [Bacillus mangrovi]|uniref:N-acetylmuramoyl-L-alanine amidase CwlD n=1 Tax=Metabacillus mangrovi TaxID=1491830 RepID=A0A7X2S890_9BACI|nr:N-acetylmuramoyl-L-alanine amidase CwlD [Metabacillus mangrovi]MTH55090.1 N-acetylmuramoyl-L-alanine amidase CwlD [Metabacillus mangrovi]
MLFQFQFAKDDSWRSWSLPLSGKVIYLDPGHGGPDGGAVGRKLLEKDVALELSKRVRDYLQEQGALVLMTRESDIDLSAPGTKGYSRKKAEDLHNRVNLINQSTADMYISLHLNALPQRQWRGAQTFYDGKFEENGRMAKFIQDELRRNLENTDRHAKPIHGVYLVKYASKPGALVEVGFLSNGEEEKLFTDQKYLDKVAGAVYKGILRFYTDKKEPPE